MFTRFLGDPVVAAALVVGGFLFFVGLGSLLQPLITDRLRGGVFWTTIAIAGLVLFDTAAFPTAFETQQFCPAPGKSLPDSSWWLLWLFLWGHRSRGGFRCFMKWPPKRCPSCGWSMALVLVVSCVRCRTPGNDYRLQKPVCLGRGAIHERWPTFLLSDGSRHARWTAIRDETLARIPPRLHERLRSSQ